MLDFVIVGGAQAGLSMAYYLNKLGKTFVIIDKEEEVGASWLNRWDSLKLFTPSEFNNLPGMDFPAKKGYYPSKEDVAAYFKKYVATFNIEVRLNTLVKNVVKEDDFFILKHSKGELKSQNVFSSRKGGLQATWYDVLWSRIKNYGRDLRVFSIFHGRNIGSLSEMQFQSV